MQCLLIHEIGCTALYAIHHGQADICASLACPPKLRAVTSSWHVTQVIGYKLEHR